MNQKFSKPVLRVTILSTLFFLSNFVLADEPEEHCDNVVSMASHLNQKDLFTKSRTEPALQGQFEPTHYDKEGMKWFAYFLTGEKSNLDLTQYITEVPNTIRQVLGRYQSIFYTPGWPVQVFYVVGDAEIRHSKSDRLPENAGSEYLRAENAYAIHSLVKSFEITVGDRTSSYSFPESSYVVILSRSHSGYGLPAWDSVKSLAHEMAHVYTHEIVMWEFLKSLDEGLAMFKTLVVTDDGSDSMMRDISIEDVFIGKSILEEHQAGEVVSSGLWNTYLVFKEFLEKRSAPPEALYLFTRKYVSRVFKLIESMDSPFVSKSGEHLAYQQLNSLSEERLRALLNFFASVSMQFAFELQALNSPLYEALPQRDATDLAVDIGLAWRRIGARGPYRRYRDLETNSDGATSQKFLDEKYNGVSMPERWESPNSLTSFY